jgi:uncharacterized protein YbjQ (UPF0145 family)
LPVNEFALLTMLGPRPPAAKHLRACFTGHRTGGRSRATCPARTSGRCCGPATANFTQALYDARELAMRRMQTEAQELGAEGIVGVSLSERSHGWGSHVIEFFALGTAIIASDDPGEIGPPVPVLDPNDR